MRKALAEPAGRRSAVAAPASPAARAWAAAAAVAVAAPRSLRAGAATAASADAQLKSVLLDRLDPELTVPRRTLPRVRRPDPTAAPAGLRAAAPAGGIAAEGDPLDGVRAAPSFPAPMYDALVALAPDFVLPGAADIPADSVLLLQPDAGAVAAFIAGLNHELARELVWRGFPVDRRATFFRTFWDGRGTAAPTPALAPLASWDQHAALADLGGGRPTVLAVRGDLLRRYPRTRVSAVRAVNATTPADESTGTVDAGFTGFMAPDLRFFGFNLGGSSGRSTPSDPGWFFVLAEQATEARFGGSGAATGTAADVANAALRPPVRIMIHADDLLP
jgi:hypothetical protein